MVTSFTKSSSHGKSCHRDEPIESLKTVQFTYPPYSPSSPVMQAPGWSIGLALDKNSFLPPSFTFFLSVFPSFQKLKALSPPPGRQGIHGPLSAPGSMSQQPDQAGGASKGSQA